MQKRQVCSYLNDFQHLHPCDLSVPVQVIHVKGPVELLLKAASWCDRQSTDELPEINGAVAVLVKGPEGMLGKLGRITIGEELELKKKKKKDVHLVKTWLRLLLP